MNKEELIYLIRCGNEWAFDTLYAIYLRNAYYIFKDTIYNKSLSFDNDEIIHIASFQFMNIVEGYREDKAYSFNSYLNRCLKNQVYSSLRKVMNDINTISLDNNISEEITYGSILLKAPVIEIPDNVMVIKENEDALYGYAKKELTNKEYDIYSYSILGYSPKEISQILEISLKSVYNGLYRVSKKIGKFNI